MAAGDSTMYRGTTGNSYAMKASGYNQPVTVVQQQPATYSTVQPVTYTTVQPAGYTAVQPTGTYSTVQPTGTYSTVQPVHYTSTSDPSYVYTNTTPVYGQSGIQSNNVSSRVQTYPVSWLVLIISPIIIFKSYPFYHIYLSKPSLQSCIKIQLILYYYILLYQL